MAPLPSLFETFLSNIRPTAEHRKEYIRGHESLRALLQNDDTVVVSYVGDFLQGSYVRYTAVKPVGDEKSDVDVVLVTKLDKSQFRPKEAMEELEPFLKKHYEDQWNRKDRSYQIEGENVEIDLVLTAAPSEATKAAVESLSSLEVGVTLDEDQSHRVANALGMSADKNDDEWKQDPLDIPDRRLDQWNETHPLATIEFTLKKNDLTEGHYVNVVKAIKWWRRTQLPEQVRPRGYPLEHIVGCCCPDDIESVAEGVARTFEEIERRFATEAERKKAPFLPARGLPETNVFERISGEEFAVFYEYVVEAADLSREALDRGDKSSSRDLWYSLFGEEFPEYGKDTDDDDEDEGERGGTFSSSRPTSVSDQRFA